MSNTDALYYLEKETRESLKPSILEGLQEFLKQKDSMTKALKTLPEFTKTEIYSLVRLIEQQRTIAIEEYETWKPIATAPKDGLPVDLIVKDPKTGSYFRVADAYYVKYVYESTIGDIDVEGWFSTNYPIHEYEVIGWKSLPRFSHQQLEELRVEERTLKSTSQG